MKETLVLRFLYNNQKYELNTYAGEYRNLMELIKDRIFVFGFGDCGGLGRCGTCLVNCGTIANKITLMDRNEDATLKKMNIANTDIHLSCQILVDKNFMQGVIKILEPE